MFSFLTSVDAFLSEKMHFGPKKYDLEVILGDATIVKGGFSLKFIFLSVFIAAKYATLCPYGRYKQLQTIL